MLINAKLVDSKGRIVAYIIDGQQISREDVLKYRKELRKNGIYCNNTGLIRCDASKVKIEKINAVFDFDRTIKHKIDTWYSFKPDTALYVTGPRQVGKTYEVKKYSKSHFKTVIYIDITDKGNSKIRELLENAGSNNIKNIIENYCKEQGINYTDDNNTVIIIDEIQDSEEIYSLIRIMNRCLNCRLIVTGSYLGILVFKDRARVSAGDFYKVDMSSLTFSEFCAACKVKYNEGEDCKRAYEVYRVIGGYPAVVKQYLRTGNIELALDEVRNIWNAYIMESNKYFKNMLFSEVIQMSITTLLKRFIDEKGGEKHYYDEATKAEIVQRLASKNISVLSKNRDYINDAIAWLNSCGIIGKCEMNTTGKMADGTSRIRYYVRDTGLLHYFARMLNLDATNVKGYVTENFVYNELRESNNTLSADVPWCSIIAGSKEKYELDFIYKDKSTEKLVGIEVKTTDGTTKSLNYYKTKGFIKIAVKAGMIKKKVSQNRSYIEYPVYLIGSLNVGKVR